MIEQSTEQTDRSLSEERLALMSVLQELTVAALDLFHPQHSADRFLERVAERLDCVAALWLERNSTGHLHLASAAGLSRASRQVPLGQIDRPLTSDRVDLALPYSELNRPHLIRWCFPLPVSASSRDQDHREERKSSALLLYFLGEPQHPLQYRGMIRRLVGILGTVLLHRELYARTMESEQRLHQQKTLLESQSEASVEGILLVSPDEQILSCNRRFVEMWGLQEEIQAGPREILLRAVAEKVAHPDRFLAKVDELSGDFTATTREEIQLKDGRILERYAAPIRSTDGVLYGRGLYFRDVTEQRRAEEERDRLFECEQAARLDAEAEERRSAFLAEATGLLGTSLDVELALKGVARLTVERWADGCVVDMLEHEQGFRRIAVERADSAPENTVLQFRGSEPDLRAEHGPGRVLRTGEAELSPSYLGVPMVTRGLVVGAISLLSASSNRRLGQADLELAHSVARRAALAIDSARLYRQAQDAIGVRDEFLSVASHELKTPVTSLQLVVQRALRILKEESLASIPPDVMLRTFETIQRQTRRLGTLVNTMLDVSRLHAGKLELDLEQVDLSAVVRNVVSRFEEETARSGSQLTVRADAPVLSCLDRSRIDQVITNLLSNALKYGEGKPIDVSVTGENGIARLVVRDHGIGIPPGRMKMIFQPFERAVSARSYGGLGLGLHIVRRILEMLKGTIRVESELGRGTTFTVDLPLTVRS